MRFRKEMLPPGLGEKHQEKSDTWSLRKGPLFLCLQAVPLTVEGKGRGVLGFRSGGSGGQGASFERVIFCHTCGTAKS